MIILFLSSHNEISSHPPIVVLNKPSAIKVEKWKRVVLTLHEKINICKRLQKGENNNVLMNEYNGGSSTIYNMKAQKEELLHFSASSETCKLVEKQNTQHKPQPEQL